MGICLWLFYNFITKSLDVKYPSDKFNILDYIEFNTSPTRSAKQKLRHKQANTNLIMNSYFYCLPRLWNSLPVIDLSCSLAVIKYKLKAYFLLLTLIVISHVLITTFVCVVNVLRLLPLVTIIAYNVTVYSILFLLYFYCS